jgi:hypothetical protein
VDLGIDLESFDEGAITNPVRLDDVLESDDDIAVLLLLPLNDSS